MQFWKKLKKKVKSTGKSFFDSFIGKTKDDVDKIDTVAGATISSKAVKDAVKNAFEKIN